MATARFHFAGAGTDELRFTPISPTLANLPNGAGTIAVLARQGHNNCDVFGLNDSAHTAWYHGLSVSGGAGLNVPHDDDGIAGATFSTGWSIGTTDGNVDNGTNEDATKFEILVIDWPAGASPATERLHISDFLSNPMHFVHENSTGNNGGNRAGPGTSGHFRIGTFSSTGNCFGGDIALVAVWVGVRFTDAQAEELWTNKRTSDWLYHSAGRPTFLVELTTLAPKDLGSDPSTFSGSFGSVSLNGIDPPGWSFDGNMPYLLSRQPMPMLTVPDQDTIMRIQARGNA